MELNNEYTFIHNASITLAVNYFMAQRCDILE